MKVLNSRNAVNSLALGLVKKLDVDLGRLGAGVPEDLADGVELRAERKGQRGERVPGAVERDVLVYACGLAYPGEPLGEALPGPPLEHEPFAVHLLRHDGLRVG